MADYESRMRALMRTRRESWLEAAQAAGFESVSDAVIGSPDATDVELATMLNAGTETIGRLRRMTREDLERVTDPNESASTYEMGLYDADERPVKEGITGELIECLECGQLFRHLASHLPARHNMHLKQYRAKHGADSQVRWTPDVARKLRDNWADPDWRGFRLSETRERWDSAARRAGFASVEEAIAETWHEPLITTTRMLDMSQALLERFRSEIEPAHPKPERDTSGYQTCLECGKSYSNIGTHMLRGHSISMAEYRKRHSLPPSGTVRAQRAQARRDELAHAAGFDSFDDAVIHNPGVSADTLGRAFGASKPVVRATRQRLGLDLTEVRGRPVYYRNVIDEEALSSSGEERRRKRYEKAARDSGYESLEQALAETWHDPLHATAARLGMHSEALKALREQIPAAHPAPRKNDEWFETCLDCGARVHSLWHHLRDRHDSTVVQYRERHGLERKHVNEWDKPAPVWFRDDAEPGSR